MKILTFSTLYPNAARPGHGIFVETRLRHLLASGAVQSTVVAPGAVVPVREPASSANTRSMPARRAQETRNGIRVLHPRYPLLPKVGMTTAPALLAAAALARAAGNARARRAIST